MNTESNRHARDSRGQRARLQLPPTRPLYWSVRRELWENRSIYIAPLIVAAVRCSASRSARSVCRSAGATLLLLDDPAQQRAAIEMPYDIAALMMIFTVFIVGVFYCLDALHGERRDRSILFWKSLPVSDLTTVLSKVTIPLVVLPLIAFALVVCVQLIMLLDEQRDPADARNESGNDVGALPGRSELAGAALRPDRDCALACADLRLAAAGLGWARRATFLWAVLPFIAIEIFEKITFGTSYFASHAARPFDGIRAARFRFSRRGPPHDRFADPTHSGKIPEQSRVSGSGC